MTRTSCRVALLQLCTPADPQAGLAHAQPLVDQGAADGAELLILPETSNLMRPDLARLAALARPEEEDILLAAMRGSAARHGLWLLIGSIIVRTEAGRLANRSLLIDPSGAIAARYDKIHLFDATLPGGETHRESDLYAAGGRAVVAPTPWGGLGLSICYDLRFPELYRDLALAGAAMIAVPAAFTRRTGAVHWETLLRARAIETGSFILAAGQGGDHEGGAATWGHSMIVSPWGEVLAGTGGEAPAIVTVTLDLDRVAEARRMIPALQHRRPYSSPQHDMAHQ